MIDHLVLIILSEYGWCHADSLCGFSRDSFMKWHKNVFKISGHNLKDIWILNPKLHRIKLCVFARNLIGSSLFTYQNIIVLSKFNRIIYDSSFRKNQIFGHLTLVLPTISRKYLPTIWRIVSYCRSEICGDMETDRVNKDGEEVVRDESI